MCPALDVGRPSGWLVSRGNHHALWRPPPGEVTPRGLCGFSLGALVSSVEVQPFWDSVERHWAVRTNSAGWASKPHTQKSGLASAGHLWAGFCTLGIPCV